MTTSQAPATRATGNGRREAFEDLVDQMIDFWRRTIETNSSLWVQTLEMQGHAIKSVATMVGPLYSAVDEADRTIRAAIKTARDD